MDRGGGQWKVERVEVSGHVLELCDERFGKRDGEARDRWGKSCEGSGKVESRGGGVG